MSIHYMIPLNMKSQGQIKQIYGDKTEQQLTLRLLRERGNILYHNECWLTKRVIDCTLKTLCFIHACGASVRKHITKIASSERAFFKLHMFLVE